MTARDRMNVRKALQTLVASAIMTIVTLVALEVILRIVDLLCASPDRRRPWLDVSLDG